MDIQKIAKESLNERQAIYISHSLVKSHIVDMLNEKIREK